MDKFNKLASKKIIMKAISALEKNGIKAYFSENKEEARQKLLDILPENSEAFNMTSMTLEETKIAEEILNSGKFIAVRNKLEDKEISAKEKRQLGAAPDFAVGSVHAVTQAGEILVASATGSQLPAYAYGAKKVIWIVGAQKIVKNIPDAMKRIYQHSFVLEDKRALKAYGMHSGVNKILIINKEIQPERLSLIFVNEILGF